MRCLVLVCSLIASGAFAQSGFPAATLGASTPSLIRNYSDSAMLCQYDGELKDCHLYMPSDAPLSLAARSVNAPGVVQKLIVQPVMGSTDPQVSPKDDFPEYPDCQVKGWTAAVTEIHNPDGSVASYYLPVGRAERLACLITSLKTERDLVKFRADDLDARLNAQLPTWQVLALTAGGAFVLGGALVWLVMK